jgi:hypothetical protein
LLLLAAGCAGTGDADPSQLGTLAEDLQCKTVYRDQYHSTGTSCGTTSHSSICGPTSASMLRQTMTCGECTPSPGDVRTWYSTYAGLPAASCAVSKSDSSAGAMPATLASTMKEVGTGKRFDDGCPAGTVVDHCTRASVYTIANFKTDLTPASGYAAVVSGDMSKVASRCCSCTGGVFGHTIFMRAYDPATETFEVYDPDAVCNHNPRPHPANWTAAEVNAFSSGFEVTGLCVLLGKGFQAGVGATCSSLPVPPAPVSTDPADGLDFACGNSMRDGTVAGWVDWDNGFFKGSCSTSQAATGLSISTIVPSFPHDLLCRLDDAATYQHQACRTVLFYTVAGAAPTSRECADNEYVAGASQTTGLKLHSIRCCAGQVHHTNCVSVAIGGDETREDLPPAGWKDWDPGYEKVECGAGRFVAGVEQQDGVPTAIRCCGAEVVVGPDAGSGSPDAGPGLPDASAPEPGDGGEPVSLDAAAAASDATVARQDGGAPHPAADAGTSEVASGCGCGVPAAGPSASGTALLMGLALACLKARRRTHRDQ